MRRVLVTILVLSLVFTGAAVATGIDVGAPNCHDNHQAAAGDQPAPDGHLPQMQAVCDCDCPCCNYAAHLIPIPSLPSPGAQTASRTGDFAVQQYTYQSLQYPPPTPPPNT